MEKVLCAIYQGNPELNLWLRYEQICQVLERADVLNISFVCFPEGFLTGYYDEEELVRKNSLLVGGDKFAIFLENIRKFRTTLIIGFNEIDDQNRIFDSAAVIEKGKVLGVQRKHYQYHTFCSKGNEFVPFVSKGVSFGVVVCLDANYFEPARLLALQGADILFVPCCNKVSYQHTFSQRPEYYSHFAARAHENRCWVLSADWVWRDQNLVCPGHSAVYDSDGREVTRSREYEEGLMLVEIPNGFFRNGKGTRVYGSKMLWNDLTKYYE